MQAPARRSAGPRPRHPVSPPVCPSRPLPRSRRPYPPAIASPCSPPHARLQIQACRHALAPAARCPARHRSRRRQLVSATAPNTAPGPRPSPTPSLYELLEQLRLSHGVYDLPSGVEAVVSGRGKHLGSPVEWSLRWTREGAFIESITGKQLSFTWGYDGGEASQTWEVGRPSLGCRPLACAAAACRGPATTQGSLKHNLCNNTCCSNACCRLCCNACLERFPLPASLMPGNGRTSFLIACFLLSHDKCDASPAPPRLTARAWLGRSSLMTTRQCSLQPTSAPACGCSPTSPHASSWNYSCRRHQQQQQQRGAAGRGAPRLQTVPAEAARLAARPARLARRRPPQQARWVAAQTAHPPPRSPRPRHPPRHRKQQRRRARAARRRGSSCCWGSG
jgi:hypothetical protein